MSRISNLIAHLKREPVVALAAFAALVQFVSTYLFALTDEQQSLINAAAVAVVGTVAAFLVSTEKGLPFLVGLAQAIISLALGFKAHLSPDGQAAIMGLVTTFVGLFVRTQVSVPTPIPAPVTTSTPLIRSQAGGTLT